MGITIGLYYNGARYLAAWLGRWTSADPIGMQAGVNLYQYCRGSPVMMSDPSGLDPSHDAMDKELQGYRAAHEARYNADVGPGKRQAFLSSGEDAAYVPTPGCSTGDSRGEYARPKNINPCDPSQGCVPLDELELIFENGIAPLVGLANKMHPIGAAWELSQDGFELASGEATGLHVDALTDAKSLTSGHDIDRGDKAIEFVFDVAGVVGWGFAGRGGAPQIAGAVEGSPRGGYDARVGTVISPPAPGQIVPGEMNPATRVIAAEGHGWELTGETFIMPAGQGANLPSTMVIDDAVGHAIAAQRDLLPQGFFYYGPGAKTPQLILTPPVNPSLSTAYNSLQVNAPTLLSDILAANPNSILTWAACRLPTSCVRIVAP